MGPGDEQQTGRADGGSRKSVDHWQLVNGSMSIQEAD